MASVCNPAPSPKPFLITGGRHRLLPLVLSLPIWAPAREADRRFWTWAISRSVETEAKGLTKLRSDRREVSCHAEVASGEGVGRGPVEGPGFRLAKEEEVEVETVPDFDLTRLEAYTERYRTEVLSVNALVDGEEEEVIVFKGFSSSVTHATPDDPSEPALPPTALIQSIDRMRAPYSPFKPQYIERGLVWQEFHRMLEGRGL